MRHGICLILSAVFAIAVGIALSVLPGPDGAAHAQRGGDCPLTMGSSTMRECRCTAQSTERGNVWGTEVYTADSPLCRAARHAGVIDADGGLIRVRTVAGRSSYPPSTRNGISSNPWGSYGRSLQFEAAAQAQADPRDRTATPGKHIPAPAERDVAVASCPRNATGLGQSGSLTCECAAGSDAVQFGNVWGSNPYTADSALCRAARHAGAIGPQGGIVTIRFVAGRNNYQPSQRNGVSSNPWGAFANAFSVEN